MLQTRRHAIFLKFQRIKNFTKCAIAIPNSNNSLCNDRFMYRILFWSSALSISSRNSLSRPTEISINRWLVCTSVNRFSLNFVVRAYRTRHIVSALTETHSSLLPKRQRSIGQIEFGLNKLCSALYTSIDAIVSDAQQVKEANGNNKRSVYSLFKTKLFKLLWWQRLRMNATKLVWLMERHELRLSDNKVELCKGKAIAFSDKSPSAAHSFF